MTTPSATEGGGEILEALHLAIEMMGQDQAAQPGNLDGEIVRLRLIARNGEQG
jgi:hypothetical protein